MCMCINQTWYNILVLQVYFFIEIFVCTYNFKSTYLALKNLNDLLKDGVTYIRDVGSIFDIDIELSKLEKVGELVAPGIIAGNYSWCN